MAPRGRIYLKQYNKQRSSAANAATHTSKVAHSPCAPVPQSMHGSIIVNKRRAIRDNRYYSKRTSGTQVPESRPPIPVQLCTHRLFVAWAAVACCKLEQLSVNGSVVNNFLLLLAAATWGPPPHNRCILRAGARLHVAPGEIRAIQKRLALAEGQFRIWI